MLILSIGNFVFASIFLNKFLNNDMQISSVVIYNLLLFIGATVLSIVISYIMYKIKFDKHGNYKEKLK